MQNVDIIVYETATGRIIQRVFAQPNTIVAGEGQSLLEASCDDLDKYYVENDQLMLKGFFEDGVLAGGYYTVNCPQGTKAFWQGEEYIIDDGSVEVLVDQQGTFVLILEHPHYTTRRYSIEN